MKGESGRSNYEEESSRSHLRWIWEASGRQGATGGPEMGQRRSRNGLGRKMC